MNYTVKIVMLASYVKGLSIINGSNAMLCNIPKNYPSKNTKMKNVACYLKCFTLNGDAYGMFKCYC